MEERASGANEIRILHSDCQPCSVIYSTRVHAVRCMYIYIYIYYTLFLSLLLTSETKTIIMNYIFKIKEIIKKTCFCKLNNKQLLIYIYIYSLKIKGID